MTQEYPLYSYNERYFGPTSVKFAYIGVILAVLCIILLIFFEFDIILFILFLIVILMGIVNIKNPLKFTHVIYKEKIICQGKKETISIQIINIKEIIHKKTPKFEVLHISSINNKEIHIKYTDKKEYRVYIDTLKDLIGKKWDLLLKEISY